jgi:hypothetical protein
LRQDFRHGTESVERPQNRQQHRRRQNVSFLNLGSFKPQNRR